MIEVINNKKNDANVFFDKITQRNQIDLPEVTKAVEKIVKDVREKRDEMVIEYSKKFDNVQLEKDTIKVSKEEIKESYNKVEPEFLEVIKKAKKNILDFHAKQLEKSWISHDRDGEMLGQLVRPIQTVCIYSPGGTAAYPSSVLMNAIPAKVAGVERIIMMTPPKNEGVSPYILVAANEAGIDEVYQVGGAQAVAAAAFGTETIPKADKIVGPGNIYVNTAKRMVFGYCDIDMFAGPSEILIIADETANAEYVAADLISQAEHDVLASSILISVSEKFVDDVKLELEKQVEKKSRKDIIKKSLKDYGALIVVDNISEAIELSNKIAPEHLEVCINEPFSKLNLIKNAGAIFVGNYSPESLGDYMAGTNHVLPTSGTARFFSPLSVCDFQKRSSLIYCTREALGKMKDDIIYFANKEGLDAHGDSIGIRFKE